MHPENHAPRAQSLASTPRPGVALPTFPLPPFIPLKHATPLAPPGPPHVPRALTDNTVVSDTAGKELFHITNKLIAFRKTILGTDQAEDKQLFKVVKKMSCTFFESFKLDLSGAFTGH